jgi:hypothetical protein
MNEDFGLKLLAAIEALAAEVRDLRAGVAVLEEESDARENLQAIRERKAASQAKWRGAAIPGDKSARRVSRETTVASRENLRVEVVKDLKQRDQDQKQLPPRSISRESTQAPTKAAWDAYSTAYESRHGVRPADSAAERGKLKRFISKVPAAEAPDIAAFFLTHNDALYIRAKHPIDLLVRDAQKLRTEWLNGRQVTGAEARQQEQTQTNLNGWNDMRRPNALVK